MKLSIAAYPSPNVILWRSVCGYRQKMAEAILCDRYVSEWETSVMIRAVLAVEVMPLTCS
jgi:hypothetical protein